MDGSEGVDEMYSSVVVGLRWDAPREGTGSPSLHFGRIAKILRRGAVAVGGLSHTSRYSRLYRQTHPPGWPFDRCQRRRGHRATPQRGSAL